MRTQEFNSKLISLLPLDEVPLHVPLRRPRPLRFERLRVGGEGKADANLTNFLSTCCAWHPNSPPRPGEAPHPAPSARKSVIRLHRKLPSAPLRAPRRFGIRKSASNSGHSPLRGLGGGLCFSRSTRFPFTSTASPPFRSSDFAGLRRPRLYGFHTGTRSLSNRKGCGGKTD